ncbi:hypothetical protein Poli38472_011948 [Pythium oligandrum]|uniref:Protein kinase domain-containing protein n=1 Tax=Pythium oligandrum TaxID=41045 RepID=A0A8K1CNJ1_PYTOL|nr:hypothetical protein Poli38472_011948 [Pythium oligandrum]|eukprot:TMW66832.1 hypothetical protein Poli38472_011948 [Pythium oligandrum]
MAFDASLAVLMAAKYCKQYPLFRWREEVLPEIGRREEKLCCRVDLTNLLQDQGQEMLMTLFPAQLSFVDFQKENTLYKLKALMVTMKHPYILPVVDIYYSKGKKGVLVVQPFIATGSLKDRINRSDPSRPYKEKYRLYHASPLEFHEVARFGRQILEALNALRSKGVVCDHLSTGNIVIDQGNARIADIYIPLLAIDRHKDSRELTVSLEARVDVDVLLFGRVLYEMATGMELTTPIPADDVLELLPPEIADVLDLIFYQSKPATDDREAILSIDDESASIISDGSGSSNGDKSIVDTLLECALFTGATDVPPIKTLFSGFRFDSGMKSTIRHSMRINASRNHAYVVQYKEKEALIRARQRAERRVHDEREKNEKRAQQVAVARVQSSTQNKAPSSRRKTYRANSFRSPLDRQPSAASA